MKVEEYNGSMTGKVFDPQAIMIVAGSIGDPINPFSTSPKMSFTEYDKARGQCYKTLSVIYGFLY